MSKRSPSSHLVKDVEQDEHNDILLISIRQLEDMRVVIGELMRENKELWR